jgi:hypothetical protein
VRLPAKDRATLAVFRAAFHQDCELVHDSLEDAAAAVARGCPEDERARLATLLARLLAGCDDAELKGHWTRIGADIGLPGRAVRHVFITTLACLPHAD